MSKKIALCGANTTWHERLMRRVAQLCWSTSGVYLQSFDVYGTIELDIVLPTDAVHLITLQRSFLYERLAVPHVLRDITGIIYVVSSVYPKNERFDGPLGAYDQRKYFRMYVRQAQAMNLNWDAIPKLWVAVTNRQEWLRDDICVQENPLADTIPADQGVMKLDLDDLAQVQQVWRAVLTLCGIAAEEAA